MKILLTKVGKRYNRDWIFRHLDYEFSPGTSYAITGPNGSGKSTLLQVVAGAVVHTEGSLSYHPETLQNGNFDAANAYQFLSIAAPYLELIEEMTLLERASSVRNCKYGRAQIGVEQTDPLFQQWYEAED